MVRHAVMRVSESFAPDRIAMSHKGTAIDRFEDFGIHPKIF